MKKHIKEIIIGVLSIAIVVGCFIYRLEDPINLLLNEGYYQEAYDICRDNAVKNEILEENKIVRVITSYNLRYFNNNGEIFYISDLDSTSYNSELLKNSEFKYFYKVSRLSGIYYYWFSNSGGRVLEVKESDLKLANEYLNDFSKNNTNLNMRYLQDFLELIDKLFHTSFSISDDIYYSEELKKELFDCVYLLNDLYNVKPVNNIKLVAKIYGWKKEGKLDRIKEIKR